MVAHGRVAERMLGSGYDLNMLPWCNQTPHPLLEVWFASVPLWCGNGVVWFAPTVHLRFACCSVCTCSGSLQVQYRHSTALTCFYWYCMLFIRSLLPILIFLLSNARYKISMFITCSLPVLNVQSKTHSLPTLNACTCNVKHIPHQH